MNRFICLIGSLFFLCPSLLTARDLDCYLSAKGLVDISRKDSTIQVYLMYAYPENIMGDVVYEGMTKAWLRPEAAEKLLKAQELLKKEHPGYTLIVYDAARPMKVQQRMWDLVKGTDKTNYVSNPANGGGLHNYGMAVDVSILDANGKPLPMGSPVDFFGEEAHTDQEEVLLESGKITREEFNNRRLLRRLMQNAGFRTIVYEWWHFNACSRAEARERFPVIE